MRKWGYLSAYLVPACLVAGHLLGGWFFFAVPLFVFGLVPVADHHANAGRPYQTLRQLGEHQVLPTGYAGMITLALVPPLWRHIMDPRALAARAA